MTLLPHVLDPPSPYVIRHDKGFYKPLLVKLQKKITKKNCHVTFLPTPAPRPHVIFGDTLANPPTIPVTFYLNGPYMYAHFRSSSIVFVL